MRRCVAVAMAARPLRIIPGVSFFESFDAAVDGPTVDSSGRPVHRVIDGVLTRRIVNHPDHRGRVFEVVNLENDPEYWTDPIVQAYVFSVRESQVKGWGVHAEKDDRYTLIDGELVTVLFDARFDSPTYGLVQRVHMSRSSVQQLLIPAGVWHCNVNVASQETFLVNFPTKPYRYEAPDRLLLPWNTDRIPVRIDQYFPRQFLSWDDSPD